MEVFKQATELKENVHQQIEAAVKLNNREDSVVSASVSPTKNKDPFQNRMNRTSRYNNNTINFEVALNNK